MSVPVKEDVLDNVCRHGGEIRRISGCYICGNAPGAGCKVAMAWDSDAKPFWRASPEWWKQYLTAMGKL